MATASPFAARERDARATFVERDGIELPEQYGDPDLEYRAVREAAGLVDLSFRGLLQLTGSERLRWLNGRITNEVKSLKAGEGMLAGVLTAKGHLLSDLAVYGLEDSVWIDLPHQRVAAVREAFERYIIADDVQVEVVGDRWAHLTLVGPQATRVLAAAGADDADGLAPWHHMECRVGGVPVRVVSSRWLALRGYDLIVAVDAAAPVWDALLTCGRDVGVRPVGMSALECLRVEARWAWFGIDFDETNLLMESLTAEHVSLTKGCYVGQEVVIRIEHQGHLNKRLGGLVLEGTTIPARGAAIHLADRPVGRVTSAVRSPALGRVIALAYLRRECWEPGTRLRVAALDGAVDATVTALPFVGDGATGKVEDAR